MSSRKPSARVARRSKGAWRPAGDRALHEIVGASIPEVIAVLKSEPKPIHDFLTSAPRGRGLYAIYGPSKVWRELGLGRNPDGRPLYIGKRETDASERLKEHFGIGYKNALRPLTSKSSFRPLTSKSSFRRSLAGLLREAWDLHGVPRYPNKKPPSKKDNAAFGLANPDHEERLTQWMQSNLRVAAWVPDPALLDDLDEDQLCRVAEATETAVKAELLPPCCIDSTDPPTKWRPLIVKGRSELRREAEAFAERHQQ